MREIVRRDFLRASGAGLGAAKQQRYLWDAEAVRENAVEGTNLGILRGKSTSNDDKVSWHAPSIKKRVDDAVDSRDGNPSGRRNLRTVWNIATAPYKGAHFATFPPALIEPCILAGSRPGDTVLDPFFGSGTTGEVCERLGRKWIGCELNPEYMKLAQRRTAQQGLVL